MFFPINIVFTQLIFHLLNFPHLGFVDCSIFTTELTILFRPLISFYLNVNIFFTITNAFLVPTIFNIVKMSR